MVRAFLRNATEGKFILNEFKKIPNAIKGRLSFLSPNSKTYFCKRSKGRDVYGESALRQCVSIPLVDVPEKFLQLLHTATGNDTAVYYFGIILRPYLIGFRVLELTQLSLQDVFSSHHSIK